MEAMLPEFDVITLTGLRVMGTHGVLPTEHETPQEFRIDVELDVDSRRAANSDDLADTVNYAAIADAIVAVVEGEHCDLIEKLAAKIADATLIPGVYRTSVTVHKPQAPIPHAFDDVSVTVTREGCLLRYGLNRVVIGLGSNQADPEEQLAQALREIEQLPVSVVATSSFYRSAPVLAPEQEEQPDYLNAVVILDTELPPLTLLEELQNIEAEHGRIRRSRWEARPLDLDIIDIFGLTSDEPVLTVPHPRAAERRFVLEPWYEIDPDAELAGTPIADLLPELAFQELTVLDETAS